ncbi:MAG: acetate kinase, partial [Rhodococcus sp. (in: high G+C Gram-positive bacteria)]
PAYAYMYGLPYQYYEKFRVRRYGAHGTSHQFVAGVGAKLAGLDVNNAKIITCHLGAGSSICAIQNGKCVDTSMGITPLDGLVMGTRCGTLDPAVVEFICNRKNMTPTEVLTMMNKKSGLLGISGKSSDCRDIDDLAANGDENAILAQEMLIYGIKKYIGSYAAAMGGVDVICFTAGIGENNADLRARVIDGMEFLGAKIDPEKNKTRKEAAIS